MIRANVWDGVSSAIQHDMDVIWEGNKIVAIEKHGTRSVNSVDKYVDAAGKTLIPGMWEVHSHSYSAKSYLASGFTTMVNMGGNYSMLANRELAEAGKIVGPRLFVAAPVLDTHRGNNRMVKDAVATDLELSVVQELSYDLLKVYVRAPLEVMARVARKGNELGIPSFSHYLGQGIQMGLSGSAHLYATSRMSDVRVGNKPWYDWSAHSNYQDVRDLRTQTGFNVQSTGGPPGTPDPGSMQIHRLGGLVALGTDFGPAAQLHKQLAMAAEEVGNLEAMKMVTLYSAQMLFADNYLGSIEVGKVADLVIVDGNPLDSVENAKKITYVVKNGFVMTPNNILAASTLISHGRSVLSKKEMRIAHAEKHRIQNESIDHNMHAH